jgi:hypothetical protein
MTAASAQTPQLKALLTTYNKRGARLQVRLNEKWPERGPYFVIGSDEKGRRVRMVGTEEFLCRMMRDMIDNRSLPDPEEVRARRFREQTG